MEWNNVGLAILDCFTRIDCNPHRKHPLPNASYAAYNGLFSDVLKHCGAFPPTTLSINKNICLVPTTGDSSPSSPTVVGGPGKTLHHDTASSLSGIGANIILLRDKAKINNGIVDNGTLLLR